MVLFNTSATIGAVISAVSTNILGSDAITGVWILLLVMGLLIALGLNFSLAVIALVPMSILLLAYGYTSPIASGLIIIFAGFIASYNFFK